MESWSASHIWTLWQGKSTYASYRHTKSWLKPPSNDCKFQHRVHFKQGELLWISHKRQQAPLNTFNWTPWHGCWMLCQNFNYSQHHCSWYCQLNYLKVWHYHKLLTWAQCRNCHLACHIDPARHTQETGCLLCICKNITTSNWFDCEFNWLLDCSTITVIGANALCGFSQRLTQDGLLTNLMSSCRVCHTTAYR
jgi:hypothetical protein